ncbi:MAG: hypothetical protein NT124_01120 [Candidatus Dependentiae bacterium]|nr:hypothetical protein [Candidatus Dependentiae bacterium]
MNKLQLLLVSLMLPVYMGHAVSCCDEDDQARGVVELPCGRIVAAGYSNKNNCNYDFALAGYTQYGFLDHTFGDGINKPGTTLTNFALALNSSSSPSNDIANAIAVQKNCNPCDFSCKPECETDCNANCKLVVVGYSAGNGNCNSSCSFGSEDKNRGSFAIARYNCDGTLDTSFGEDKKGVVRTQSPIAGGFAQAKAVAIQDDGKIVVVGETARDRSRYFMVARYTCDGILDTTFGCNGTGIVLTGFSDAPLRIQPGYACCLPVSTKDKIEDSGANAVKIQKNGKIVVAGFNRVRKSVELIDFALARYNTDGSLDTSFGPNHDGKVITDFSGNNTSTDGAFALVLLEDCQDCFSCADSTKIVAVGPSYVNGNSEFALFALAGYTDNGKLDRSFGPNGNGLVTTSFGAGTASGALAAALQRDCNNVCKIVAAGSNDITGKGDDFILARYTLNGLLDTSFGEDKTGKVVTDFLNKSNDVAFAVTIQKNGAIVAAGSTNAITPNNPDGNYAFALARYNQCQPCC